MRKILLKNKKSAPINTIVQKILKGDSIVAEKTYTNVKNKRKQV